MRVRRSLARRVIVKVDRSALASVLLEAGEENAAVLLIRAPLPDVLDTDEDVGRLAILGLEPDALDELLALAVEGVGGNDGGAQFEKTVSERYSALVASWPPRLG